MANIVKWYDERTAERYPLRMVAIDYTKDRDALVIRVAKNSDPEDMVFNPETELGSLWLTLKGSKMNVVSSNLVLYGTEIDEETGLSNRIEPAIPNEKKPQYGYAYTAKQLEAFPVPKNLFMGAQLNMHGAPLFMVSALPYKGKQRARRASTGAPKPALTRITAKPDADKAPSLKRQR